MTKIAPRPSKPPTSVPPKTDVPAVLPEKTTLPQTAPDGTIMINASKYARNAVLTAFEMIGGTEELANWGRDNKTDFTRNCSPKRSKRTWKSGPKTT